MNDTAVSDAPAALTNQRAVAALCLNRVTQEKLALPLVLADACRALEANRTPLVQQLCYGACRLYPLLSGLVNAKLQKPLRSKDLDVFHLLVIGVYQLQHMRLPPHAALNETVNALKPLGKTWAKGLVNGVLRNIQRDYDTACQTLKPFMQRALPNWLDKQLGNAWPEQLTAISEAFKTAAPLTIRVNQQQTNRADYQALLSAHGIESNLGRMCDDALILTQAVPVDELPHFYEGMCSVQDEAAQLSAKLIAQYAPTMVLDACAAPGGKTGHLLEQLPNDAQVTAIDNEAARLAKVEQNLDRLGLAATLIHADAAATEEWWNGERFDAILLDAPCSATGVIRRNPDIKLLRREKDAKAMPALQEQILQALWQTLKPGGHLIYATCSLLPMENDGVIGRALAQTADMLIEPIAADWGVATEFGRQLFPQIGGNDGFYYACLHKRKESP